ncbi:MAG TPA: YceI family protein [Ktedonobacterales bacterium]
MARWELDPAHSTVGWSVRHLGIAAVKGRFTRFSGQFDLDERKPALSQVTVTVEAASVQTGNQERDEHIRSFDFFDAERFPTITFTSEAIAPLGFNSFLVEGPLRLHGKSFQAHLEVTFNGARFDPEGNRRAGFTVHTHVPLSAFDLNWNVALPDGTVLVGSQAELEIEVEVVEQKTSSETGVGPAASGM